MNVHWPKATEAVEMAAGDVQVWAVPLDEARVAGQDPESVLSDDERRRAARYSLDAPRRRFVVSRAALRTILGRLLNVAPREVPLTYAGNGKPQLQAGELRFNLAHSGELALVAVATGCAVGVDVERRRPVRQLDEIAERFFAPAEIDAILAVEESQRTEAFLRCWTRKEAILKAIGTGLGYPLDLFAVPIGDATDGWVELPASGSIAAVRCWLAQLDPSADYLAAVATLGESRRPVCFALS